MATCPTCGFRKLTLTTHPCDLCERPICKHCAIAFAYKDAAEAGAVPYGSELAFSLLGYHRASTFQPPRSYETCSWDCFADWAREKFEQGDVPWVTGDRCKLAGLILSPEAAQHALQLRRNREAGARDAPA